MEVGKDKLESPVITGEGHDRKLRFAVENIIAQCQGSKGTHKKISPNKARSSGLIRSSPLLYITARRKVSLSKTVVSTRASETFPIPRWTFNKKLSHSRTI